MNRAPIRAALAAAALFAFAALDANAQPCSGISPAGSLCGNPSGAGAAAAPTRTPVLGLPGSVLGSLGFANTTSGTITLRSATGALGSSVLTLPATTGTLATTTSPAASVVVGTTTVTSGTSMGVLFNNASILGNTAAGTSGYALIGNGASAPTFQGFLQNGTGAAVRPWQSKAADSVNAKDFGVACDGSADDLANINKVVAAAAATSVPKNIVFPAGVCRVTGTIAVTTSGITITSESGPGSTTFYRDFTTGPTISFNAPANAAIANNGVIGITFTRNLALTPDVSDVAHVKCVACLNFTFENIRADNVVEGLQLVGGAFFYISKVSLVGQHGALGGARFGIKSELLAAPGSGAVPIVSYLWMNTTWLSGPLNTGFDYPLKITSAENWNVTQSYFGQAFIDSVAIIQGSDNAIILDVAFDNVYVDSAGLNGVLIDGSAGNGSVPILGVSFTGSFIKGNGTGVGNGLQVTPAARGGTFSQAMNGLTIADSFVSGWLSSGIRIDGGVDVKLSGNTVRGNNYLNTTGGVGVLLGAAVTGATVSGNRIGGDANGFATSAFQAAGINILSGCTNYAVYGNSVQNNTTAISYGSASGISFGNPGDAGTTGSGAIVLATSPTLVTPTLGAASATSINKVAITAPATSATLTIPNGVTLTGPAASGTAMTLGNAETVTGAKTFGSAGAVGKLKIAGTTSGSTVLDATAVASGTLTLPAATDTLVGKATTDELTSKTLTASVGKGTWTTSGTWTLPAVTLGGAITYGGVTLSNAVTGTGKMVLDGTPTLTTASGTGLTVLTTSGASSVIANTLAKAVGLVGDASQFSLNLSTSNGTSYNAGVIQAQQAVATNGSQSSVYNFYTTQVAVLTLEMQLGGGMIVGSPTGGAKGVGTINAAGAYYANGTIGVTGTKTVRAAGGGSDCTLVFTSGLLTGGSC